MDKNDETDQSRTSDYQSAADVDRTQQVIYAVSHDLRAPARHIHAFLGLLASHIGDDLDEVGAGYMARVTTAAEVFDSKLDALATYSRVVTQGLPLRPCLAGDAVAEALSTLQPQVDESGAQVEVGDLPIVLADPNQLVAVFVETVGNSLKFCPPGVSIGIDARLVDGVALIRVADSGPGFTDQNPERAIELFRRFHAATVPGAGAGLAIVERIMARHGGQITITTGTDRGTTVELGFTEAAGAAAAKPSS